MHKHSVFVILLLTLFCLVSPTLGQRRSNPEELFSEFNARIFHKIAYEMYTSASFDIEPDQIEQAIIFLLAANALDQKGEYVYTDMLALGSMYTDQKYSAMARGVLEKYVDETADLEIANKAVKYLLKGQDSREDREAILLGLLQSIGESNDMLRSELATQLALLTAERADFTTARAILYNAYQRNPHNKLALAKIMEIEKMLELETPTHVYAKHLRLAMGANPLDIEAAFGFARYTEKLELYDLAASAYRYTAELFGYLYPENKLPESIYLPWAITNYNTKRGLNNCLEIASVVRESGRFDIVLEGIAVKAARKMGQAEKSKELSLAGRTAENMLAVDPASGHVSAEQVGWFYCFAAPERAKALAWANSAYSKQPNQPQVKAILAYALAINGQTESADELASELQMSNQIGSLTKGMIHLDAGRKDAALISLKAAVAMDPTSLAAEKAKELLQQNGSEYITDAATETILSVLITEFGERIVPRFSNPAKLISTKLNITGSEFSYGKDFSAALVITNNSYETLLVSRNGLFSGNIRVDANIHGDITSKIPNLVSKRVRPGSPIESGQYVSIPLDLNTGPLRKLLFTYPQASLEIEFTAYLDPLEDKDNNVRNTLRDIEPVKAVIKRPGVALTGSYMMQSLDALNKGKEGQRLRVVQLFCGLLMEQYAMADSGALYRYEVVPRKMLTGAIRKGLNDEEWKIKVHTMALMLMFPLPLDYDLTRTVSDNIYDDRWPVRMMAIYLLSKSQGDQFKPVLDWTAKYDLNQYVRLMVIALGAEVPEALKEEPPLEEDAGREAHETF